MVASNLLKNKINIYIRQYNKVHYNWLYFPTEALGTVRVFNVLNFQKYEKKL